MVGLGGRCRVPWRSGRWGTVIGPQNPLDYRPREIKILCVERCSLYVSTRGRCEEIDCCRIDDRLGVPGGAHGGSGSGHRVRNGNQCQR